MGYFKFSSFCISVVSKFSAVNMYSFYNKDKITDHAKGCSDSLTTRGPGCSSCAGQLPCSAWGCPPKTCLPTLLGLWAGQSWHWFSLVLKWLGDPSLTGGFITTLLDGPLVLYCTHASQWLCWWHSWLSPGVWLGHGLRRISEAWRVPPAPPPSILSTLLWD